MGIQTTEGPPYDNKLLTQAGLMVANWLKWLFKIADRLDKTPEVLSGVSLTGQSAAIAASVLAAAVSGGVYQIAYFAKVEVQATTNSSLTTTIGFTRNGVACSFVGAALTSNLTSSVQSGIVEIRVDEGTSITYSVAYSSTGATPMTFGLDLTAKAISA